MDFLRKIQGEFSILDDFLFKGSSQIKLKANSQFSIIVCLFIFKGISYIKILSEFVSVVFSRNLFHKIKLVYLTGWKGGTGWRWPKAYLIYFVLRYVKHYTHIYLNIYKKIVRTNFFWVFNFGQVGGGGPKIQNHNR